MKIGDNIQEIREVEKNLKRSYVANRLNISTRAYCNIENNVTDISLNRLEEIAMIFECTPEYILNYKQSKKDFLNYFHNYNGNRGVNVMNQGVVTSNSELLKIQSLQYALIESEKKRIELLEQLLKINNHYCPTKIGFA